MIEIRLKRVEKKYGDRNYPDDSFGVFVDGEIKQVELQYRMVVNSDTATEWQTAPITWGEES